MFGRQVSWRERLGGLVLVVLLLIPSAVIAQIVDRDNARVTFLRWIDDQAGVERGSWPCLDCTEIERTFYRDVRDLGVEANPDFETLSVIDKWNVLLNPTLERELDSFEKLVAEGSIHLNGAALDWGDSDVSANVGALLLGFRKAVADVLWLNAMRAWDIGLLNRMVPLIKTVVRVDPQFINGYTVGSWHIAYNVAAVQSDLAWRDKYVEEGRALLEVGLRRNPRSSELYEELGWGIYYNKMRDFENASYYLLQGIQFEPHEPRMERTAARALEDMRDEQQAADLLEEFDKKHPNWKQHKLTLKRLRRKIEARQLERGGDLRQALSIWREFDTNAQSEPVAPKEVLRLEALIRIKEAEASGDLARALDEAARTRSFLPEGYRESINAEVKRLSALINAAESAG